MSSFEVGADIVWPWRGVGQEHRQVLDKGRDMKSREVDLDDDFTGDNQIVPHLALKDKNSESIEEFDASNCCSGVMMSQQF